LILGPSCYKLVMGPGQNFLNWVVSGTKKGLPITYCGSKVCLGWVRPHLYYLVNSLMASLISATSDSAWRLDLSAVSRSKRASSSSLAKAVPDNKIPNELISNFKIYLFETFSVSSCQLIFNVCPGSTFFFHSCLNLKKVPSQAFDLFKMEIIILCTQNSN